MKKALRKLIPALVMLLIAAAFVGTSTYAWFSMNRIVDVTGMSVTTKVEDSLLIAGSNAEANYVKTLSQTREGKLRPVSTVDGVTFYYTNPANVKGDGDANQEIYVEYSEAAAGDPVNNALSNTNAGKTNYDKAFQIAYGIPQATEITTSNVLYGYIDYAFYIKATNTTGGTEDLKLDDLNLLYYNGTNNVAVTDKAWRVAVFAQNAPIADGDVTTAPATGDRKAILTLTGATNRTSGQAVDSTSTLGSVTYTSANSWKVAEISAGATAYTKVTIRLWLEGEDSTCTNSTYATLSNAYSLSVGFVLGGSENSVTVIGSTAA